jgi:hypothetical protein
MVCYYTFTWLAASSTLIHHGFNSWFMFTNCFKSSIRFIYEISLSCINLQIWKITKNCWFFFIIFKLCAFKISFSNQHFLSCIFIHSFTSFWCTKNTLRFIYKFHFCSINASSNRICFPNYWTLRNICSHFLKIFNSFTSISKLTCFSFSFW